MEFINTEFIVVVIIVVTFYYVYIKIDLADVTGLARKSVAKHNRAFAKELGYKIVSQRAYGNQEAMSKKYNGYDITVDGFNSQIEVDFHSSFGMRLFSTKNQLGDQEKLSAFKFNNSKLNRFFVYKVATEKAKNNMEAIESVLLPLIKSLDNRRLKYLYIKDEYLRIGFAYRNYLPLKFIRNTLPIVQKAAEELKAIKKAKYTTRDSALNA